MPSVGYPATLSAQEISSGLSVHQGVQSASCLRVTGSNNGVSLIAPRDGPGARSGLELIHIPYSSSGIQSYDREHGVWLDLALNARNIALAPQSGGKVSLPAGAAQALLGQYVQAPTWTLPQANVWTETPAQVTAAWQGTTVGMVYRIEFSIILYAPVAMVVYVGIGNNGSLQSPSLALSNFSANETRTLTSFIYWRSGAGDFGPGTYRTAIWVYASAQVQTSAGGYTQLYVTEQRA